MSPRAQHNVFNPRLVLRREDRVGGDEVAHGRADLPPAHLDDLRAAPPPDPRPPRLEQELRDDHVGVDVDPHAATIRSREPETTSAAPAHTRRVTCSAARPATSGEANSTTGIESRFRASTTATVVRSSAAHRPHVDSPTRTAATSLSASPERPAVRSPSPRRETANART